MASDFLSLTAPQAKGFDVGYTGPGALDLYEAPKDVLSDFDWSLFNLDLDYDPGSFDLMGVGNASTPLKAANESNAMWADFLGQAREKQRMGAMLNMGQSAGDVFNSVMGITSGTKRAREQRDNAVLNAENQMAAIENQAINVKTQLQSRFNSLVARTQVNQAARGLKVSLANTLEENKSTAVDVQEDFDTIDSNKRLQDIILENQKAQANVAYKANKDAAWVNFAGSLANLGFMGATGGGTMQSWGSLFPETFGKSSLSKSVYGG